MCAPRTDEGRGNVSVGTGDSLKKRGCEDVGQVARGWFLFLFSSPETPWIMGRRQQGKGLVSGSMMSSEGTKG